MSAQRNETPSTQSPLLDTPAGHGAAEHAPLDTEERDPPDEGGGSAAPAFDRLIHEAKAWRGALPSAPLDDKKLAELARPPATEEPDVPAVQTAAQTPAPANGRATVQPHADRVTPSVATPDAQPAGQRNIVGLIVLAGLLGGILVFSVFKLLRPNPAIESSEAPVAVPASAPQRAAKEPAAPVAARAVEDAGSRTSIGAQGTVEADASPVVADANAGAAAVGKPKVTPKEPAGAPVARPATQPTQVLPARRMKARPAEKRGTTDAEKPSAGTTKPDVKQPDVKQADRKQPDRKQAEQKPSDWVDPFSQ